MATETIHVKIEATIVDAKHPYLEAKIRLKAPFRLTLATINKRARETEWRLGRDFIAQVLDGPVCKYKMNTKNLTEEGRKLGYLVIDRWGA